MTRRPGVIERYFRRSTGKLLCVFEPGICEIFTLRLLQPGGLGRCWFTVSYRLAISARREMAMGSRMFTYRCR